MRLVYVQILYHKLVINSVAVAFIIDVARFKVVLPLQTDLLLHYYKKVLHLTIIFILKK